MNLYKMNTTVKRQLLRRKERLGENTTLKSQRFSFAYINNLFKTYAVDEYVIESHCCYGEDTTCWYDVDSAWIEAAHPNMPQYDLNRIMYKDLKGYIKDDKVDICKRKIFILENEKNVMVFIPLRDINTKDISISFNKTQKLN